MSWVVATTPGGDTDSRVHEASARLSEFDHEILLVEWSAPGRDDTIVAGFRSASHPLVAVWNPIQSPEAHVIDQLVAAMEESKCDAVIAMAPALRSLPSRILSLLTRRRFGVGIWDVHSCPAVARRELLHGVQLRTNEIGLLPAIWSSANHRIVEKTLKSCADGHDQSAFLGWWRLVEAAFLLWTIRAPSSKRGHWRWLFSVLLVTALAVLVDLGTVGRAIGDGAPLVLGMVALANLGVLAVKTARWRHILAAFRLRLPFPVAFHSYLVGSLMGTITPMRVGSLIRANAVLRHTDTSVGRALGSVVIDRLFDLMALFCLAAPALIGLLWSRAPSFLAGVPVAVALLALAAVRISPTGELVVGFGRPQLALCLAALSTLASYALFFGLAWWLAKSMHIDVNFLVFVGILAGANLLAALPFTVAGLGTREIALVVLLAPLAVDPGRAAGFAVAYFFVFYVSTMVFGACALGVCRCD